MKAIFITYNQALSESIMHILDDNQIRGFTRWQLTEGRGSLDGEPHYGSHAWPAMNSSVIAIVQDDKVKPVLSDLKKLDEETKMQGSRAFVWNVEQQSE